MIKVYNVSEAPSNLKEYLPYYQAGTEGVLSWIHGFIYITYKICPCKQWGRNSGQGNLHASALQPTLTALQPWHSRKVKSRDILN